MKYLKNYLLIVAYLLLGLQHTHAESAPGPDHSIWSTLLKKYVDNKGRVNYEGFIRDKGQLDRYLQLLGTQTPDDKWSRDEQLAYWINAYNALTVKLITQYYPINTIKDIKKDSAKTPWKINFFKVGDKEYSLDNIEHDIIRRQFNDPRTHFALASSALSGPKLRNEAYIGTRLNEQLDDQLNIFINDNTKNNITPAKITISKIFIWYRNDFNNFFTDDTSLIDFLKRHVKVKIRPDAMIVYMDHDWQLNKQ